MSQLKVFDRAMGSIYNYIDIVQQMHLLCKVCKIIESINLKWSFSTEYSSVEAEKERERSSLRCCCCCWTTSSLRRKGQVVRDLAPLGTPTWLIKRERKREIRRERKREIKREKERNKAREIKRERERNKQSDREK